MFEKLFDPHMGKYMTGRPFQEAVYDIVQSALMGETLEQRMRRFREESGDLCTEDGEHDAGP